MFYDEDLPALLNPEEFAVTGTLGGASVNGIFDTDYAAALVGDAGMAASGPAFMLPTADVPSPVAGKLLIVPAGRFTVAEHHPNGTGLSVLLLERTA